MLCQESEEVIFVKEFKLFVLLLMSVITALAQMAAAEDNLVGLWNGNAKLNSPEHIIFLGNTRLGAVREPGRVTLLAVDGKVYAFFRQDVNQSITQYEIYRAVSTDGVHFVVEYEPVIPCNAYCPEVGNIMTAYDPDVTEYDGSYWLCFEGAAPSYGYAFSSFIAHADSITGAFLVVNCAVKCGDYEHSASTPNFLKNGINDDIYLTWVNVHMTDKITTHHIAAFPGKDLTARISNDPSVGQLTQTTGWANMNFGSAGCIYEAPYYYMFYEGADYYGCGGQWGIGFCRTANIADNSSWVHCPRNPLLWAESDSSCWISYPKIALLGGKYYLYYENPYTNWPTQQTVYRRKIQINTSADFNNDGHVDFKDLGFLTQTWSERN